MRSPGSGPDALRSGHAGAAWPVGGGEQPSGSRRYRWSGRWSRPTWLLVPSPGSVPRAMCRIPW